MAVGDACVFPGFLTPVLTQLFFPKPPTTFLTCFCRGERRKYAGKKSRLNLGSNSQPPGHESDTLTTEPPERGHQNARLFQTQNLQKVQIREGVFDWIKHCEKILVTSIFSIFSHVFEKYFFSTYLTLYHAIPALTHYQMTNFSLFRIERLCRRVFQI